MTEDAQDKKEQIAVQFGFSAAIQTVLRALIRAHPDPEKMTDEFRREHEETMAILLRLPIPDKSIEVYEDFILSVAPNPDVWLEK